MPHDDLPDLDLIQMVQQARRAHDAQAQPSQVAAVYWIEASAPKAVPTASVGYWLIRTDLSRVDADWAVIKASTEAGRLGYKSKVATASRVAPDERVIQVLTVDAADEAKRIGAVLRELGFQDMTYVADS